MVDLAGLALFVRRKGLWAVGRAVRQGAVAWRQTWMIADSPGGDATVSGLFQAAAKGALGHVAERCLQWGVQSMI